MIDNKLQSLIEKIANDSGWNICTQLDDDVCIFNNSYFPTAVYITIDEKSNFLISFSDKINLLEIINTSGEYQKPLNDDTVVIDNKIIAKDKVSLSKILFRASELIYSEPSNPLREFEEEVKKELSTLKAKGEIITTEREATVKQRVGQDKYRTAQLKYWGNACAVTGCDVEVVLRASHAKPWSDCKTDDERLDVYNGFLLSADLDALFDKGLISFTFDGEIMVSPKIHHKQREILHLTSDLKLRWIQEEHYKYLDYHHKYVWKN